MSRRTHDDGWVEDELQDGSPIRYRIHLDRISEIPPEALRVLTDAARSEGVAVADYIRRVAEMPKRELHVHRDRIRRGEGGDGLALRYEAWLEARRTVHGDMQFLSKGAQRGDRPFWL
ncbi:MULTISPECIES: hypothetical protein [unclassified Saccharopolyspora]|uniref:hypothetical protein n=1 Tax=unclassified Saccharopolyspora TaxID=2646250 RepID=UPI001CD6A156|nr:MULTISPECIES: hypothetical protein [unclassified Saccharopolyspora]MCA1188292.1 hypothetical protein [Saccharopolyspora sp. 6T]MCA1193498.1 hypothetical protein [Saccharopolyspora sp. 6V]MCA1227830.1 hypothetical protein [Saccharopolyspora sp. 6M]MCA1280507.1 hypothetical protein [Saccharopolyspora sp. 7B]